MSQARITLRPPPNVEFVEGYPGIPAGHDRPHAEVRGSIELRLPAQGTKAKWVRVELKKVETLPGGGQSNTFYDFVGQSPVKVWEASGEWSLLHTQDFPFAIRIPESIPPSIALDKGAGIKYELNATLCTKGKKGFFFKKTDATLSTSHAIIIDKHELHSTWPVYAQPESRHVVEDLLILTVDRSHTCYGPGDRVKVLATFKNDGIPAAALRAFEFLLKETIIYRAGPNVSGKKGAPQVHVTPIGEQKVPVNMTVYQGQQHRAELGCFIPQTHTTTTVSAARHMDIAYSINVKAVMGTGKPLLMELPVTVSNWPRNMSIEAIRRIGPAPSLSLIAPISNAHQIAPNTISATRPSQQQLNVQPGYNTAPAGRSGLFPSQQQQLNGRNNQLATMSQASSYGDPITGPRSSYDEFGGPSHPANPRITSPAVIDEALRRPPVITGQSQARRLTLANAEMDSEPESPPSVQPSPKKFMSAFEEKRQLQNAMNDSTPGGSGSSAPVPNGNSLPPQTTGTSQRTAWPTAEEEKQRLYNSARQKAQHTQQIMGNNMSPMPETISEASVATRPVSPPAQITMPLPEPASAPAPRTNTAPKKNTPWPTAEEEKMRLYNSAQNAARRVQAQGGLSDGYAGGSGVINESPPATKTSFSERPGSSHDSSSMSHDATVYPSRQMQSSESKSAGAQLYQHAISSMSRNPSAQASRPISPPSPPVAKTVNSIAPRRSHPTAEEEKAALRYYEAKRAVDRHQHTGSMDQAESSSAPGEGPIPYDDLYPSGPSSRQGGSSQAVNINGYGRRMSEATSDHGISPPASPPPPMIPTSTIESALSEKERLRRKYEAEDAASSSAVITPPTPPARASGSGASPPGYGVPPSSRSQPLPPTDPSGPRLLTAAEEKARLRAQMEAEDAAAGGSGGGSSSTPFSVPSTPSPGYTPSRAPSLSYANNRPREEFSAPPPPPPLAPRPPAEYIQQTKEEDLRTRTENVMPSSNSLSPPGADSRVDFGLSFRPFSPLDLGITFDAPNGRAGSAPPPPPLPPKVPVSQ